MSVYMYVCQCFAFTRCPFSEYVLMHTYPSLMVTVIHLINMRALTLALVVATLAASATTAVADRCGGNCPSNTCPSCPCGISPKPVNIAQACAAYSGWSQACCQCIAQKESAGNNAAANYNTNGSFDVGLWQINKINWNACAGGGAPCDLNTNRNCAIQVWKWGGNTWRLWSTCGACGCCGRA